MLEKIKAMQQLNKKTLSDLTRWQKSWDDIEKTWENPDPALQKFCIDQLANWTDLFPEYKDDLGFLNTSINESYEEMMRRYRFLLQQDCEKHGYHLEDGTDNLTIDGYIRIELHREKNHALINGKKSTNLSISGIMERINKEYQRIWQREFDPIAFLEKLFEGYTAVCNKKVVSLGDNVYLRDVYQELRLNKKEYVFDLFAADLSLLRESEIKKTQKGYQVTFSPIRDSQKAVYIYNRKDHNGRYLGLIRFVKENMG